jgi:hypothetical protein
MGLATLVAAKSKVSTASRFNDQPVAPTFSRACCSVLAPGIGTVPLHIAFMWLMVLVRRGTIVCQYGF